MSVLDSHIAEAAANEIDSGAVSVAWRARGGQKAIRFRTDPAAATQLRVTAATTGRTVQSIMEEALDDGFRKHRLTQATAP